MSDPEQNKSSLNSTENNYLKGSQESWDQLWQGGSDVNYLDPGSLVGISERIKVDSFIDQFLQAPGKRSLECGCGLATVSMLLADRGFDIYMLDSSPEALRRVKKTLETTGRRGTLLLGDINAIPVPDGTYDLVHSYGVLEHFAGIEESMGEMLRILKPGGVFFADIVPAKQGLIHRSATGLNHTVIFAGALLRLRLRKWWNFFNLEKRDKFYINHHPLDDYLAVLKNHGLLDIKSGGYGLFPSLVLPAFLKQKYLGFILRHRNLGITFNKSGSAFSRQAGFGWWICGVKPLQ
jgi:SAM-dependent methyltransferase